MTQTNNTITAREVMNEVNVSRKDISPESLAIFQHSNEIVLYKTRFFLVD